MTDQPIIEASGLRKVYRRYERPFDRLFEWLTLGGVCRHDAFVALQGVDLEVRRGECVGVIGENGAGKSTLLKLISGVAYPTAGTVRTTGRVVSLLELGAGFNADLDGIRNIYASGRLLGYSDDDIRSRVDRIVEFAELGEFIREPLKTYSSGMYVRLAFSLFAFLDPDVYIVDEALSVGDVFFQQKCFKFMESLKDRGVAVLLASHDMQAIARLADRVLLLERGQVLADGDPMEAINMYYARHGPSAVEIADAPALPAATDGVPADARLSAAAVQSRWGRGAVRFEGARLVDEQGRAAGCIASGARVRLQMFARAHEAVDDLTFGFQILDRMNTALFGQSIYQKDRTVLSAQSGERFEIEFRIDVCLGEGRYVLQLTASDCGLDTANDIYDFIERGLVFEVQKPVERVWHGIVALETDYTLR